MPLSKKKINVKEHFDDGVLDISLSDLTEIPVKDIIPLKKLYHLDLSNNRITSIPPKLCSLTNLLHLNLSKNELKELPEDIGNLSKLRHLDLSSNSLEHLPLSIYKLKALQYLNLSDNPLVPAVAKVAGDCSDLKECKASAKNIVRFFTEVNNQVEAQKEERSKEKLKQLEINKKKQQEEKKAIKKKQKMQKQEEKVETELKEVKKTVKKAESKPESKKASPFRLLFKTTLLTLFLTSTTFFLLTSVKTPSFKHVEKFARNYYSKFLSTLPESMLPYGYQFGNAFGWLHQRTGESLLTVVSTVASNEYFKSMLNTTVSFVESSFFYVKEIVAKFNLF